MSQSLTLYKLIILYMLKKVNFPLTNAHILDFFLEQNYTTYFTLQQVLSELEESELIHAESIRNTTQYSITGSGIETLNFFKQKINMSIRDDIDLYLKEHKMKLRNEVSVKADYYRTTSNDYAVNCTVKEKEGDLISLTLTVPLEEQAASICRNWSGNCQEIYSFLMKTLMK